MKATAADREPNSRQRLEAILRSGAQSDTLMAEISAVCNADPGAAWETLALVDQFHRRGIVSHDLYRTLKQQTEILALGRPNGDEGRPAPPPALASPAFTVPVEHNRDVASDSAAQAFRLLEPSPEAAPSSARATQPGAGTVPPSVGRVLRKRYLLEAPLDYGRGVVFQALDSFRAELPAEEQRVAIRFPAASTDAQREFYRLQSLAHPNVARVHEFDRDGDLAFYTMELIRGRVLCDLLVEMPKLPMPMPEALAIIRDVGAALVHAHAHQVVHGHLDAHSVMVTDAGEVRVLDFDRPPETGADPQPSDDLQALAVLAYELLAGQHPFQRRSTITDHPAGLRVRRPVGLSRRQWRTLQYGLAWTRKKRGRTLASWLRGLELERAAPHLPRMGQLLRLRPTRAWRPGARIALVAGVALAAIGLFAMAQPATLQTWLATAQSTLASLWQHASTPDVSTSTVIESAPAAVIAAPIPEVEAPPTARPLGRSAMRPGLRERGIAADDATSPSPVSARDDVVSSEPVAPPANHGRLEFPYDTLVVAPGDSVARVVVRRVNGTQGEVAFSWWTENGTARAGEDFAQLNEQTEIIPEGQDSATLLIPLVDDSTRGDRTSTFFVNIEHATGGATLGENTHLVVTLRR